MKTRFAWLPLCAILFFSCTKNNYEDLNNAGIVCDSTNVSYQKSIVPIINSQCATSGCHNAYAGGDITLLSFEDVEKIAKDGRLIGSITHSSNYYPMPKSLSKLTDCQIATIRNWIKEGIKNN